MEYSFARAPVDESRYWICGGLMASVDHVEKENQKVEVIEDW